MARGGTGRYDPIPPETSIKCGKNNIALGLLFMAGFMLYGLILIYLRDFAPGKEAWLANEATGRAFESRLAQVHGNIFAFINMVLAVSWLGVAVARLSLAPEQSL